MSAIPIDPGDPLFDQLAASPQLTEWDRTFSERAGRLLVLHTGDGLREATALASAYRGTTARLGNTVATSQLGWTDLVLVVCAAGSIPDLTRRDLASMLDRAVTIYGLTGARPNPVADHCHDTVAIPRDDTATVRAAHRLVIRQLLVRRAERR